MSALPEFATILVAAGAAAVLVAASINDVMTRRVPNRLSVWLALLYLIEAALNGRLQAGIAAGAIAFALAAICWLRGWMGGADVKLLGAVAIGSNPQDLPRLVAAISIAGGLLALIYLLGSTIAPPVTYAPAGSLIRRAYRAELWRLRRGSPLPYACAIAAGTCIARF